MPIQGKSSAQNTCGIKADVSKLEFQTLDPKALKKLQLKLMLIVFVYSEQRQVLDHRGRSVPPIDSAKR